MLFDDSVSPASRPIFILCSFCICFACFKRFPDVRFDIVRLFSPSRLKLFIAFVRFEMIIRKFSSGNRLWFGELKSLASCPIFTSSDLDTSTSVSSSVHGLRTIDFTTF